MDERMWYTLGMDDLSDTAERVLWATQSGDSLEKIAKDLGVSVRTVSRHRKSLGIAKSHPAPYSQEIRDRALHLLDQDIPYQEVGRTLGVSPGTVAQWFPGRAWTKSQASAQGRLMKDFYKVKNKLL